MAAKYILLSLPALTWIIILLYEPLFYNVFASSPSFSLQELRDGAVDWIDMNKNQQQSLAGIPSTDILIVNYFSNGKILNATFWLSAPFKEKHSDERLKLNYGVLIDADSNNETGVQGVDYQIEISGQNGTWSRKVSQWSSIQSNRTLDEPNYTGFFGKEGKYILLSANLDAIGSPDKYRAIFYTEQIKEGSIWKVDFTNWVHIPRPEYEILLSPKSLDVIRGENKTIEVQVKSTTGFEPIVHLYSKDLPADVDLKFKSDELHIPSYGINTTDLNIEVSENVQTPQYTIIPILADATFPSESFIQSNSSETINLKIPSLVKTENITNQSSLALTILEPLSAIDKFINDFNKLGTIIAVFVSIITFLIGLFIDKDTIWSSIKKASKDIRK
jgi:hypothetical protein